MDPIYVSVIIPVFNDTLRLEKCLKALEEQTYPKDFYQVIVIDNNSDENIEAIASQFKQVILEFEAQQGSYAARNKGLSIATGNIIAFTDSDCIPQSQWIEKGVEAMEAENADLVGGKVTFTFSAAKTPAEIYDSITNMQIKDNIATRKVSKTANLFVRRSVFNDIGLFPGELKSGGDVIWTKRATDADFKLVYSPEAYVYHPARKLRSMLKKQFRVGSGQPFIWRDQGQSLQQIITRIISGFRPPSPKRFQKTCLDHSGENTPSLFSVWLVAWLCVLTTNIGRLSSIFRLFFLQHETT